MCWLRDSTLWSLLGKWKTPENNKNWNCTPHSIRYVHGFYNLPNKEGHPLDWNFLNFSIIYHNGLNYRDRYPSFKTNISLLINYEWVLSPFHSFWTGTFFSSDQFQFSCASLSGQLSNQQILPKEFYNCNVCLYLSFCQVLLLFQNFISLSLDHTSILKELFPSFGFH